MSRAPLRFPQAPVQCRGRQISLFSSHRGQQPQHRQGGSSGDRQMETESTETIDGPNGMGRIETVSVSITNGVPTLSTVNRGITQGELLRQEQRAGVVPS